MVEYIDPEHLDFIQLSHKHPQVKQCHMIKSQPPPHFLSTITHLMCGHVVGGHACMFMYVSANMLRLRCMCEGQNSTLGVCPHPPHCSKTLFLAGLQDDTDCPVSHLMVGVFIWVMDPCYHVWTYMGSGDPNTGPQQLRNKCLTH